MCGFFGIHRPPGAPPPAQAWVESRLQALAHRGPDARGLHVRGGSALAAARLAIQGDARADPPIPSADGRIVLAFNGEILERAGLERLVRAAGLAVPPVAAGDGPLLAEALAALFGRGDVQGPHLMALLEGAMGALAAWDLETDLLWLARDRLGIKPLFALEAEDAFLYASGLAPLLEAVPAARAPDPDGLAALLHLQRPDGVLPFRGLEALRPGAVWRVAPGGRVTRWTGGQGIRDLVDRGALDVAAARDALADAVRRAARAAGGNGPPPVLFLSGGLDSGALAAWGGGLAALALTGRFAPPGGDLDESDLAGLTARAAGLPHAVLDLDDADLLGDLAAVVRALEVPMMGPGALALWRMALRARDVSRVVLTGTGGDELLGGYARTALVLGRHGPWTEAYAPLAGKIDAAGADFAARRRAALVRDHDLLGLLDEDFRRTLPDWAPRPPAGEGLEALLADEVEGTLPALLAVEDRVLMAHGLEGRPVFCLGGVPRAAARVPLEALVGPDGEGKRVLREALAGALPEAVRRDPRKRGFPTPFARAARGAGRETARAIVGERRFAERGWWNVPACTAAIDADRPVHDRGLYAMLSWELWARAFLDGDALHREDPPR